MLWDESVYGGDIVLMTEPSFADSKLSFFSVKKIGKELGKPNSAMLLNFSEGNFCPLRQEQENVKIEIIILKTD